MSYDERPDMPMRVENGRRIFRVNCRVDSMRRQCGPRDLAVANQGAPGSVSFAAEPGNLPAESSEGSDDVVRVHWRLISAVPVWPWRPPDSPPVLLNYGHDDGSALRKSVDIINSTKPDLLWSHWSDTEGVAGRIEAAYWEASTDIPPGVNAVLVVDPRFDPKMAYGLRSGIIRNGSIGLWGDYEMSHPEMDPKEFIKRQGTVVDGRVVELLLTEALDVDHFAAVPAHTGADRNAGRRIVNNAAAAGAAPIDATGGNDTAMEEQLIKIVHATCRGIGIEVALVAGGQVPDDLEHRMTDRVGALVSTNGSFNALARKVQTLGPLVAAQGEIGLTTEVILERLPQRLELARHGEAFLNHQRQEAVKLFDQAHVDPANPDNLTELDRRERERIVNSADLQYLGDVIERNRVIVAARHPTSARSSTGDDDQASGGRGQSAEERRIAAQLTRWRPVPAAGQEGA